MTIFKSANNFIIREGLNVTCVSHSNSIRSNTIIVRDASHIQYND